jgi:hypothetical protein
LDLLKKLPVEIKLHQTVVLLASTEMSSSIENIVELILLQ